MSRTKEQQREYMRGYRLSKRAEKLELSGDVAVTDPPPEPADPRPHVSVRQAVDLEWSRMPAAYAFPALQETARVLAECLDDPLERRHHPTAAAQLRLLLAEVRTAQVSDAARSSLRAVRQELKAG